MSTYQHVLYKAECTRRSDKPLRVICKAYFGAWMAYMTVQGCVFYYSCGSERKNFKIMVFASRIPG